MTGWFVAAGLAAVLLFVIGAPWYAFVIAALLVAVVLLLIVVSAAASWPG